MRAGAGWIGIADRVRGETMFDPAGLDRYGPEGPRSSVTTSGATLCGLDALMPRGTLMVETRLSPEGRPQTLFEISRTHPWIGTLSLRAVPGGGVILTESQGDGIRHATLPAFPDARTEVLRLTYSWDAPARRGWLTAECPDSDRVAMVAVDAPHPLPMSDLQALIRAPRAARMDGDVVFVALSDHVEPVGPTPGLSGGVAFDTPGGQRPVAAFRRGDRVTVGDGIEMPVLQAVSRMVPALGSFSPVHLRAPYFGLRQDIVVAPGQRLLLSGSRVEYLFGHETVLVAARHLINGTSALWFRGAPPLWRYHQLLLPENEMLQAGGAALESLFIGRLRRRPEQLARSILSGCDRRQLPEHARPSRPVLKPYEAMAIAGPNAA